MVGMYGARIASLCFESISGSLRYSRHYTDQFLARPTPSEMEIRFLLCDDDPQVIEDYPQHPRGSSCLVWGVTNHSDRIGHVQCSNPPDALVITAYFPAETEPAKWTDNFRKRV